MPQASSSGISGSIIEGSKAGKVARNIDLTEVHKSTNSHLESLFSSPPFLKPSATSEDDQEIIELNLGSIFLFSSYYLRHPVPFSFVAHFYYFAADDIVIDEPLYVSPSSQKNKIEKKGEIIYCQVIALVLNFGRHWI